MAVTRIKAYHGAESPIRNSLEYITNKEKTDADKWMQGLEKRSLVAGELVANAINYAVNHEKTKITSKEFRVLNGLINSQDILVSGYMCSPSMAAKQFQSTIDQYSKSHNEYISEQTAKRLFRAKLDVNKKPVLDENGEMIYDSKAPVWHDEDGKCRFQEYKKVTKSRTAYMWVLSFPPERVCGYKIDPRICHQIGIEFIKKIDGGKYQAVVATHMDREHPHDHIVMCAYAKDGSRKYRDTKGTLMKAREICDDLSQKFGLPIIPSNLQEQSQSISWTEWKAKQEGQSWKEQMRQDIKSTVNVAKDYAQFIQLMRASGYGIRETENHITYIMPGDEEFRCRDTKLGKEYEKSSLRETFRQKMFQEQIKEKEHELDIPKMPQKGILKPIHIFVSRYTFSGRRRTDLEMAFLTAIEIIRALKDIFKDPDAAKAQPNNPVHQDYSWKINQMMDSLALLQDLEIETKEELKALLTEVGTDLSVARKEIKELELDRAYAEKILELIEDADKYIVIAEKIGFNLHDLYIVSPDKEKIRENLAKENPATPSQRRNLYLLLQKNCERYRLGCKYDQLNAREAEEVIRFLKMGSGNRPDILHEGRWQEKKAGSSESTEKVQQQNDVLFESHLLDYSPKQQEMILNLRNTVQQLADFGIGMDEYDGERKRVKSELEYMDNRIKEAEELKQKYRNLKRLEYNCTLAETKAFTYGAAYEREEKDLVEIVESKDELVNGDNLKEDRTEMEKREKKNIANPLAYTTIDSYFDQTHTL